MKTYLVLICCFITVNCAEALYCIDMSEYNNKLYGWLIKSDFTKTDLFTDSPSISNLYYISAFVNGEKAVFFLDTGATTTQICQRFYERVKTYSDKILCDECGDESCELSFTSIDTVIKISDVTFPFSNILIVNLDFDNENRESGDAKFMRVDGKIGNDFLKTNMAIIDIIGMTAFFKQSKKTEQHQDTTKIHDYIIDRGPYGFNSIDMSNVSGWVISEAKINDVKGRFILDTGANRTVVLNNLAEKFKLRSETFDLPVFGNNQIVHGTISPNFIPTTIGSTELSTRPMFLDKDWINEDLEYKGIERIDGILGTDALFLSVICYNNMRLYIANTE